MNSSQLDSTTHVTDKRLLSQNIDDFSKMIIVVDCVSFTSLMLNLNVDREECGMQHIAAFHMFYWQQCSATISRENNQQPLQTINVAFRSLPLSVAAEKT